MEPIVVHQFTFRTETGHAFKLMHTVNHQGHLYEIRGADSFNKDHHVEVLEPETDWFTWSSSIILEYHARYADDWQGRTNTLRSDRAFITSIVGGRSVLGTDKQPGESS